MMPSKLTNLLPISRRLRLVREYYFRLGTVALALSIALISVAAVLLIPTYIFLVGTTQEKEDRLAHIKKTLSSADEVALSARLAALSNDAAVLLALSKKRTASEQVRAALNVPRLGVTLSSFTYAPTTNSNTLLISGTAATRDVLRGYQLALQGMSSATSATLPVSVYAKDMNIPFTITVALVP